MVGDEEKKVEISAGQLVVVPGGGVVGEARKDERASDSLDRSPSEKKIRAANKPEPEPEPEPAKEKAAIESSIRSFALVSKLRSVLWILRAPLLLLLLQCSVLCGPVGNTVQTDY